MSSSQYSKPDDGRAAALDDPRDLVLTASAGTGKTTMLVEKFTRVLIGKIREEKSADAIRSLVCITFTDLAAMELKERIRKSLNLAADAEERDQHLIVARALRDAVRDLDTAYIGTIHSFCRRILQENFVAAGISPGFGLLDEQESEELRNQAIFEVLQSVLSYHALEENPRPMALVRTLGLRNLRVNLQKMLDTFRSHGDEEINADEYIAKVEAISNEAEALFSEAQALLEQMENAVAEFNADGGNKTSQNIKDKLKDSRQALTPFFDNPLLLRSSGLPQIFNKDKESTPKKGNIKGLGDYKEMQESFRALIDGRPDGICLRDIELLDIQIEMLQALFSLLNDYASRYRKLKERNDKLDFDDLLLQALNLLENNEQVRTHYRNSFSHIFVDEFQDVNAVQRRIVQLLRGFDAPDSERRRLFLVGDSKQSIYRFRAADVRAYNEFARTIAERGKRFELRLNFRSHEKLIHSFNSLFSQLFTADDSGSVFQAEYMPIEAGKEHPPSDSPHVQIIEIEKKEKAFEAWVVANKIRALVEDGVPGYDRKFEYGDIAILFRTSSMMSVFEQQLRRTSIPYAISGGKDFYAQREIQDISCYLNAVWFPQDEYALAAVLRSPLCLISDESLYELHKSGYFEFLPENAPRMDSMEESEYERFSRFHKMLVEHREWRDLISSAEMIDGVLSETGYDATLLAQDAGDQSAANLRKLIELAREFEARGVGTGLEFTLDLSSRLFSDEGEAQASMAGAENAVKLMTVHKSKGLEFPVVILPHFNYGGRPQNDPLIYEYETGVAIKVYDPDSGAALKNGLFNSIAGRMDEEENAEHLRLFYVAATRARELVVIPLNREQQRNSRVESWLALLEKADALSPERADEFGINFEHEAAYSRKRPKKESLILSLSGPVQSTIENESDETMVRYERMATRPEVRNSRRMQISVSALLNLVFDKKDEEHRNEILQLKRELEGTEEQSASPRIAGTLIHNYLETLNYKVRPTREEINVSLAQLGLDTSSGSSVSAVQLWLDSDIARSIFDDSDCRVCTEVPFVLPMQLGEEQADIIGVIDLLVEFQNGDRWIIDFKYAHQKENPAYHMQMNIYALALEKSFGQAPQKVELFWLKDGISEEIETDGSNPAKLRDEISKAIHRKRSENVC